MKGERDQFFHPVDDFKIEVNKLMGIAYTNKKLPNIIQKINNFAWCGGAVVHC